jgi:hypothetical protein
VQKQGNNRNRRSNGCAKRTPSNERKHDNLHDRSERQTEADAFPDCYRMEHVRRHARTRRRPRMHGIALAPKSNHGFTTNAGDSTVTMFDLNTLAVIRKIRTHTGGLDGIMYDDFSSRIILTNHCRPVGTATLIYVPAGRDGNVTVVHQDGPDKYTVVATVTTVPGAKTITVDPVTHNAYVFNPEYGPAPADAAASGRGGRGGARGPIVAAWFVAIKRSSALEIRA